MEGNQMKMREALEEAIDALDTIMSTSCHNLREITASRAYRKCREALALPRRQCDVGTAEEQRERFERFCLHEFCNKKCPCYGRGDRCELLWAQMLYEEGEGDGR